MLDHLRRLTPRQRARLFVTAALGAVAWYLLIYACLLLGHAFGLH